MHGTFSKLKTNASLQAAVRWIGFVALATLTQLAFKWASTVLGDGEFGAEFILRAVTTPAVLLAIGGYIAMFVAWMRILKMTPLSRAYLVTAIVFVPVTFGAWLLFGEEITALRIAGITAIMIGVALMAG